MTLLQKPKIVSRTADRVKPYLCQICLLGMGVLFTSSAAVFAEDWAFRRSYYSHDLNSELVANSPKPISRSAYRIPYVPVYPGMTVYSTWRLNRVQLQSGSSTDSQYQMEGSIEFRP